MIKALVTAILVNLIAFTLLWLCSLIRKDASLVDRYWGPGFFLLYLTYACQKIDFQWTAVQLLFASILFIWSVRLGWYITQRNWGHGEDQRYTEMRKKYGDKFWWLSLFIVFYLQAIIQLVVSLPLLFIALSDLQGLNFLAGIAFSMWIVGFIFEAGGDWQLSKFINQRSSKDEVLDKGLWGLTRHPNYFGDCLQWWSFFIYALAVAPHAYLSIIGPIVMMVFLMKYSGAELLESGLKDTKPKYTEYQQQVPAFFPKIF